MNDNTIYVKYIGKHDTPAFDREKIYKIISIEKGWFRVETEIGEDYLFPPDQFEILKTCTVFDTIQECCNDVAFKYNNKLSGVTATVENYVPTYEAWYGDNVKEYNSFDELLFDTFFDGKTLYDVLNSVEYEVL